MKSDAGTTTTKAKAASERHPLAVAFGAYLKAIRIKANKSQMELAFDASIDRTYVSLLERGHANPTLLLLMSLAKPLGMPASELIAGFEAQLADNKLRKPVVKRRKNEASLDASSDRPKGSRRSPLR